MPDPDPRAALEAIGRLPDAEIDLAGAALQLARIDAPEADWRAAAASLSELARAAVAALPARAAPGARVLALARLLAGEWGFGGDLADYDNPANANLIAVLARRRGLPVSLGIVWLHALRAAGWSGHGVDFPSHFLIALDDPAGPLVLDPFDGGARLDAAVLGEMLTRVAGPGAVLRAQHLRPAGNRAILLRLTNNLRTRRLAAGDLRGALVASADMLRIAPDAAPLWAETAALHERAEQVAAALHCYRRALALTPAGAAAAALRAEIGRLIGRLQ
ncbi:MAG: SirB1 family protein [Acetobacteraceae bacterium]